MLIFAQVMSSCECLSVIARSELGSDSDCGVINARSEQLLVSDLDCYSTSESDVCRIKILMSKVDPRTMRVKLFIMAVDYNIGIQMK